MNKDICEGKWKQIRGEAKAWWGKLTDNDLDRAAGKFIAGLAALAGVTLLRPVTVRLKAVNQPG